MHSPCALLDDGESFLATTWLPPVLAHGKHGKQSGLLHQVKEILYALSGSPHTRIVWCRAGAKSADSCRLLDPPCRLCNGIALSKSGRRIFVADSLRRTIVAFDVKYSISRIAKKQIAIEFCESKVELSEGSGFVCERTSGLSGASGANPLGFRPIGGGGKAAKEEASPSSSEGEEER